MQLIEIALIIALILVGVCLFYVWQTFPIMMTLIRSQAHHKDQWNEVFTEFEERVLEQIDERFAEKEKKAAKPKPAGSKRRVTTS